jgi:hypothetical protein
MPGLITPYALKGHFVLVRPRSVRTHVHAIGFRVLGSLPASGNSHRE